MNPLWPVQSTTKNKQLWNPKLSVSQNIFLDFLTTSSTPSTLSSFSLTSSRPLHCLFSSLHIYPSEPRFSRTAPEHFLQHPFYLSRRLSKPRSTSFKPFFTFTQERRLGSWNGCKWDQPNEETFKSTQKAPEKGPSSPFLPFLHPLHSPSLVPPNPPFCVLFMGTFHPQNLHFHQPPANSRTRHNLKNLKTPP